MPSIKAKLLPILVRSNRGQCSELAAVAMRNAFVEFVCRILDAMALSLGRIIETGHIAHHADKCSAAGVQVVVYHRIIGLELPQQCRK